MTFKDLNLNSALQNALEDLSYFYPTPIQKEALPLIQSGRDMIGIAQTGTGKTFAYLLPILKNLKFSKEKHPRVLILVPTRELVEQVVGEAIKLTEYSNTRVAGIHGGDNINKQMEVCMNGIDIVVATPGRLLDLFLSRNLRAKSIQKFILDEVDEMLNQGFRSQLNSILDLLPKRRQNILFSATLTPDVNNIINDFFVQPVKLEITPNGTPLERILQQGYHVPNFHTKINLLEHLLLDESLSKILIFVDNKKLADRMVETLAPKYGEIMGVVHSNKSQNFRANAIQDFEEGTYRLLIATDLIARGIDIKDVTHVINFDTPEIPEHYIHRIGRTGRAEKDGASITFINEVEQEFQEGIEELMGKKMEILPLPEEVEISTIFTPAERPNLGDKHYMKAPKKIDGESGFHEKSAKNSKVNLGGSYKRIIKEKYKKPKTKGDKFAHRNKKAK